MSKACSRYARPCIARESGYVFSNTSPERYPSLGLSYFPKSKTFASHFQFAENTKKSPFGLLFFPKSKPPASRFQVAEKTKKSPGQVVLRWGIQRGTSVLPKSTNPDRIKQNLDVLDWELSDEDMKALGGIEPKVSFDDDFLTPTVNMNRFLSWRPGTVWLWIFGTGSHYQSGGLWQFLKVTDLEVRVMRVQKLKLLGGQDKRFAEMDHTVAVTLKRSIVGPAESAPKVHLQHSVSQIVC